MPQLTGSLRSMGRRPLNLDMVAPLAGVRKELRPWFIVVRAISAAVQIVVAYIVVFGVVAPLVFGHRPSVGVMGFLGCAVVLMLLGSVALKRLR